MINITAIPSTSVVSCCDTATGTAMMGATGVGAGAGAGARRPRRGPKREQQVSRNKTSRIAVKNISPVLFQTLPATMSNELSSLPAPTTTGMAVGAPVVVRSVVRAAVVENGGVVGKNVVDWKVVVASVDR